MKILGFIFVLSTIFLTGCFDNSSSHEASSEEKAKTYLDMGVRYLDMGELNFAKENLEKALNWDSKNPSVQNAAAALYEKIKEPEKARKHYETALNLDIENPQSQNNYGRFLCENGSETEGFEHLKIAMAMPLNNRRWFALTNAGRCLLKQGQAQQAEIYFREALLLQNDYNPALLEMLKLSYINGKYLPAKAFVQRYLNVSQPTPEFLWYAMLIELALKHDVIAEQYKANLLENFPSSREAKRVKTTIND